MSPQAQWVFVPTAGVDLDQFHLFQGTTQTFLKSKKFKIKYNFLHSLIVYVSSNVSLF